MSVAAAPDGDAAASDGVVTPLAAGAADTALRLPLSPPFSPAFSTARAAEGATVMISKTIKSRPQAATCQTPGRTPRLPGL
jgi:hypothetical protein